MTVNATDVEARLADLTRAYGVPGASLAVLHDGATRAVAAGVLDGAPATIDSAFEIGSTTKLYTATAIMALVDRGRLDLDAPVAAVLPEFRVADPYVTVAVTPRDLLAHTSGISGEWFLDCGPGEDAVARYVESLRDIGQDVPRGAAFSYSNTGYVVLGRILEVLTGVGFDEALRELVLDPLDLRATTTVRSDLEAAGLPRSMGPAGSTMVATPSDVVAFVHALMTGGGNVLSPSAVAMMLTAQVALPDPWTIGDHQGLGCQLRTWDGTPGFSHPGATHRHRSFLEAWPEAGVAIGLVTNGGDALGLVHALLPELRRELCGVETPSWPEPLERAVWADPDAVIGTYERFGMRTEVERRGDGLGGAITLVEPLASQMPEDDRTRRFALRPSTAEGHWVAHLDDEPGWLPMTFLKVAGERYVHFDARSAAKVATSSMTR